MSPQSPHASSVSAEQADSMDAEQEKGQESPVKMDKKEKKIMKKKSPFLPGNLLYTFPFRYCDGVILVLVNVSPIFLKWHLHGMF